MPRSTLAAISAAKFRRQVGDRCLRIVAAPERLGKQQANMTAALAEYLHVVPVSKVADHDPMARIRKRNRIVFHSTDVPIMFMAGNVSMLWQSCLPAFMHS